MTRVLFAWELGANYGHIAHGVVVAQRLRAEGCTTVVAARDLELAHSLLTPSEIEFVAAPRYRGTGGRAGYPVNYSDLLAQCGYSDPAALRALLRAWVNLLRTIAPEALIADHAPTALLAAKALSIPSVLIGTGFTVPPAADPMPPLREGVTAAQLTAADAKVLSCINRALQDIGHRPLARIAELFADTPAVITTFRELDHYRDRGSAMFVGPVSPPRQLPMTGWPGKRETRLLVYLNADFARLPDLLFALRQVDAEAVCVIPGAAETVVRRFRSDRSAIYPFPVDIGSLLRQATLVVTHGGAGLTTQALAAGVPLLLVPRFVEQEVSARRVAESGAGLVVGAQRSGVDFQKALAHVLTEPSFAHAARLLRSKFAAVDSNRALDAIAQTVLQAARRVTAA